MSESYSAFSLMRLSPTNQTMATPATHQVEYAGVRWVGEMRPKGRGTAPRLAIDSAVRDAGNSESRCRPGRMGG